MEFAQLKAALSKAFPAIQNRKDLETRFYASEHRRNQEPTDFAYDLLKLNKLLELGMSEKALVDHIFVRFQPQVQDYVEAIRGSWNSDNVGRRGWDERRMSNVDDNRRKCRNSEDVRRQSNDRNDYRINMRIAVKKINGSKAGIGFGRMIEDLTIGDTSLEMEVKRTILVEGTTEIGVRVRILVEAIGSKGDD
ncbi:uncharacterized protein TNCV_4110761 [Trichonephila clavipes]|nr:uncharacterized protein TNCV_4110761 [Trichonephila clavipes]